MKLNYATLKKLCALPIDSFSQYAQRFNVHGKPHFYKDNGGEVLAVAHLDSILKPTHFVVAQGVNGTDVVFSPVLDDRLGVYVILDLLPSYGLKYDVLLTTGEEHGKSTAADFEPTKEYHWMFSFDRTGKDTVLYQYDTPEFREILHKYNFVVGEGIFSDIAVLDHLECKGMNIGTGYYNYHEVYSYAVMSELKHNIRKLLRFFKDYSYICLKHKLEYKSSVFEDYQVYDQDSCMLCNVALKSTIEQEQATCVNCLNQYKLHLEILR